MSCCCTAKRFLVLLALSVASFSLSASFAVGQETPAASEKPDDAEAKAEEAPEFIYVRMETSKGPVLLELNNAKETTLVIVTHDRELASKAGMVLVMNDGRISETTRA